MNLTDKETLISFLKFHNLYLHKSLGQNFLVDRGVLEKILEISDLKKNDVVVEIGPGVGTLTLEIAPQVKEMLVIEKDRKIGEILQKTLGKGHIKNVKIKIDNALFVIPEIFYPKYKVISNLPYNIVSPTLRLFLQKENKPEELVLMVQKEVAQRITAPPGSSSRGFLTVLVEFYTHATLVQEVSKTSFFPIPQVESAIVKIDMRQENRPIGRKAPPDLLSSYPPIDELRFFRLVKAGFSQKRRQVHNALSGSLNIPSNKITGILKESQISPQKRAEELALSDWLDLYHNLKRAKIEII